MNVLGNFGKSRDCVDQVSRKPIGWGDVKQVAQDLRFVNGFEQLHERGLVIDLRKFVPTVKIYDLSQ